MLAGDYQTYLNLSIERGMEPHCRICLPYVSTGNLPQDENLVHLLTQCRGTYDNRSRIMPELLNLVSQHLPSRSLLDSPTLEEVAQFLLDCTSLNLKNGLRISPSHSALPIIANQCSSYIYAVHSDRARLLKTMGFFLSK